ncbi:hypothetical protein P4H27_31325, partial [Paenibacillus taichungensis]|uniref:hypothetical protein n=1 Tax=Paenibacillus taichungensis TaxID=484184 RepID=UPI002DC050BB
TRRGRGHRRRGHRAVRSRLGTAAVRAGPSAARGQSGLPAPGTSTGPAYAGAVTRSTTPNLT